MVEVTAPEVRSIQVKAGLDAPLFYCATHTQRGGSATASEAAPVAHLDQTEY